jgi:hypothetical protein
MNGNDNEGLQPKKKEIDEKYQQHVQRSRRFGRRAAHRTTGLDDISS